MAARRGARTRYASGRFVRLLMAQTAFVAACQTVGGPVGDGAPTEPTGPMPVVVQPGPISDADQAAATTMLEAAEASFRSRRFFEVIRTTDQLLEQYPASDASGRALWLSAQAALETGDPSRAEASAQRYLGLLPGGDERRGAVHLFQARTFPDSAEAQLDRLLRIEASAPPGQLVEGGARVRSLADSMTIAQLTGVLDASTSTGPLRAVAEARLAVTLLEFGRSEQAEARAQSALAAGLVGEDRAWAEGVLGGILPEGRGRETNFRIGVILPLGGPPALAEFSASIAEGIEVAAATVLGEDYTVEVILGDDEADPSRTAALVSELEAQGVHGIIGLLQDDDLLNASSARTTSIPLVSPTARSASRGGPSVYSLEGPDTEAAVAVASYAVSRAFQRIAIVLPQTPEAQAEADAFEQAAAYLGMPVVGRYAYEAGATFFEPQLRSARDALRSRELGAMSLAEDDTLHMELLEPTAIFMPIPPEDVEFLAPQAIHFGLDTLAIELLGTTGWTDAQVLEVVDSRLTTGIVATAAVGSQGGAPGAIRFRDAYEEYFQRTLVGTTPSIGFDATLLLLEALRPGRIAPEQVRNAFEALDSVDGATGLFSVVDGQVSRQTQLVRIQDRVPVPLTPDTVPADSLPADSLAVPDTSVVPDTSGVFPQGR
ncbi:MAG: ABC transporter substrate-binding protein [Gemmatimonadota bacterium]